MKTYMVEARREGRWWAFELPELGAGAAGQARSLSEVESEARDVAAMWLDVDAESIAVQVSVHGADEWTTAWQRAGEAEAAARVAQAEAAERRRRIVHGLREKQWSAVDVAALLGVTKARVYQLEK